MALHIYAQVVELSLGRKVEVAPKRKWVDFQGRLLRIVLNIDSYDPIEYLKAVGDTVVLSIL